MERRITFDPINIAVPRKEILSRLGFRQGVTQIKERQRLQTDNYIEEALALIKLKGVGKLMAIQENDGKKITFSPGIVFSSCRLAEFFKDCREALFMAATSGTGIMNAIKKEYGANLTRGVVFDAVASEMTDAALDWIMGYFNQQLRRENKKLTKRRYSCGYGDFLLENQKTIHRILNLKNIGIKITKSFILIPEKSVTAVAGIKHPA